MNQKIPQIQINQSNFSLIRVFLYVIMITGGVVLIFPIAWMVITALKGSESLAAYPPNLFPWPVVWRNFIDGLKILPFATFYKNSLFITISCMIGDVLTSALVAYGFSRFKFYGREIWFILVLSTMLLPLQVTIVPR
ncbi:MAG: carbohydrate ABC transporter permease, partial [Candidatus Atribacteria bacterium]|nr:carbohydrate ABC transporter permease [Candidatus Atribacteria bacterium]